MVCHRQSDLLYFRKKYQKKETAGKKQTQNKVGVANNKNREVSYVESVWFHVSFTVSYE